MIFSLAPGKRQIQPWSSHGQVRSGQVSRGQIGSPHTALSAAHEHSTAASRGHTFTTREVRTAAPNITAPSSDGCCLRRPPAPHEVQHWETHRAGPPPPRRSSITARPEIRPASGGRCAYEGSSPAVVEGSHRWLYVWYVPNSPQSLHLGALASTGPHQRLRR